MSAKLKLKQKGMMPYAQDYLAQTSKNHEQTQTNNKNKKFI